jgi:hypothetical protein
VSARLLLSLFDLVYVGALAVGLAALTAASFGLFLAARRSLAHFYSGAAMAGAVALAALVCGALSVPELRGPRVLLHSALLVGGILLMLHAANVLAPAVQLAQDRLQPDEEHKRRLRSRVLWLNVLAIAIDLALLASFALRPAPLTPGIVEPSPQERARRQEESFRKARERLMLPAPEAGAPKAAER